MTTFVTKRIYEPADASDGYRVLVDRLWPRGVSKEKAALDEWAKTVAPSNELRKWYAHEPAKFKEFTARYIVEITHNPNALGVIYAWYAHDKVTLLYGARTADNEASVLQTYLASEEYNR